MWVPPLLWAWIFGTSYVIFSSAFYERFSQRTVLLSPPPSVTVSKHTETKLMWFPLRQNESELSLSNTRPNWHIEHDSLMYCSTATWICMFETIHGMFDTIHGTVHGTWQNLEQHLSVQFFFFLLLLLSSPSSVGVVVNVAVMVAAAATKAIAQE